MSTVTKSASRRNGTTRSRENSEFSVERIGPKDAEGLLKANTHNRNLRPGLVARLAGAMQRGEWEFNGETIKIATDGMLLDGQHRLAAVIASQTTQTLLVVRGLPVKVQESIDTGSARGASDTLRLRGEHDTAWLAAALRNVWKYQHSGTFQERFLTPTAQELLAVLDTHPHIRDSIPHVRQLRTYMPVPPGPYVAVHYLTGLVDSAKTHEFFSRLALGEGLLPMDPIHTLRQQILRASQGVRRPSGVMLSAWAIKAFNAWRKDEKLGLMRWASAREPFPLIDGLDLGTENSEFSDAAAVVEALAQVAP